MFQYELEQWTCTTVLYCIMVESRRIMPPDALQPKAYLHRQVSPPETLVVKGEMADEFCLKMSDFHVTFRDF